MKDWPRSDVRRRWLSSTTRIEVYNRADELGRGRCMSFYVRGREELRFDLFTPAHMHLRKERNSPRRYFPSGLTLAQYVDLVLDELAARVERVMKDDDVAWLRTELLRD